MGRVLRRLLEAARVAAAVLVRYPASKHEIVVVAQAARKHLLVFLWDFALATFWYSMVLYSGCVYKI